MYWYRPLPYPKLLMQKAFEGYLNDIARDEDITTAWAFALHVDLTEPFAASWTLQHIHATVPPAPTDNMSSQASNSSTYPNYISHVPQIATTQVRVKHCWNDTPTTITHHHFHAQRNTAAPSALCLLLLPHPAHPTHCRR